MEAKLSADLLSRGSKQLTPTKATDHSSSSFDYDASIAERYTKMYEQFDGNIDQIFDELNENPRKVKKYPPSSAAEFGIKYAQGFYTTIESESKA